MNLSDIEQLLYHRVRVLTKISKSINYVSSFASSTTDLNGLLIYIGYLKAFDPLTNSAILCSIIDGKVDENIIILGHIIETIELDIQNKEYGYIDASNVEEIIKIDTSKKCENHPYFKNKINSIESNVDQLDNRCHQIIKWLNKNRIDAHVDQNTKNIVIADLITLRSPYVHVSDYICPTRIILKRVKNIIDSRDNTE